MKILPQDQRIVTKLYEIDQNIGNQAPTWLDANIGKQIRSLNENIEN